MTSASREAPLRRSRKTQERAELTRASLLEAGKHLFSERGFTAVSARDIEIAADVQRNLLAYHFNDKETMWKAAADEIFGVMKSEFDQRVAIMNEISDREVLAFIVRFYVHFHARNPQLSRLMSHEATHASWRLEYLVETHIRPSARRLEELVRETRGFDRDKFVHWYYIMISSTSTIFSFAAECISLFDLDPCQEQAVEDHANMLVNMLLTTD